MIMFSSINAYIAFALVSFIIIALCVAFNDELYKLERLIINGIKKRRSKRAADKSI